MQPGDQSSLSGLPEAAFSHLKGHFGNLQLSLLLFMWWGTSLRVNYMIAGLSLRWMKKEAFEVKLEKITRSDHTEGWLDSAFVFIIDTALSTGRVLRTIKK